jgi:membrane protease YdiL (CAAX protease family)
MRRYVSRYPLAFSLLFTLALFSLTFLSRAAFPTAPVGVVSDLPPEALKPPSGLEQAVSSIKSAESLFWLLAILLSAALLTWLGWWREAGFTRPSRWRNLHLLWFPIAVVGISLSGGVQLPAPVPLVSIALVIFVAIFAEEVIFRGLMLRALAPTGLIRAVVATSLLSGILTLGRSVLAGPWPEAIFLTALATCGGFTYAALRWRTASLWPATLVHFALALAIDIATLGALAYLLLLLSSTAGFIAYGLFLLRNPRVRADGGLTPEKIGDRQS